MTDRHDRLLDDLEQTGPEYAPDAPLLDAIRAAGFRLTLPGDDEGDGWHYIVTRDSPPLVFMLPPMSVRAWWWGWLTAVTAAHAGAVLEIEALTRERDELRLQRSRPRWFRW